MKDKVTEVANAAWEVLLTVCLAALIVAFIYAMVITVKAAV